MAYWLTSLWKCDNSSKPVQVNIQPYQSIIDEKISPMLFDLTCAIILIQDLHSTAVEESLQKDLRCTQDFALLQ